MYKVQDDRYWQSSERFGRKVRTTYHGVVHPTIHGYETATKDRTGKTDRIITELYAQGLGAVTIADILLAEHNIGKPVASGVAFTGEQMVALPEEPLGKNVIKKRLEDLGVWKGDRRKKRENSEDKDEIVRSLKTKIDDLEFELSREKEERAILMRLYEVCANENVDLKARLDSR